VYFRLQSESLADGNAKKQTNIQTNSGFEGKIDRTRFDFLLREMSAKSNAELSFKRGIDTQKKRGNQEGKE
jgi:hypothetical protein